MFVGAVVPELNGLPSKVPPERREDLWREVMRILHMLAKAATTVILATVFHIRDRT
jgi:hypothetical protein